MRAPRRSAPGCGSSATDFEYDKDKKKLDFADGQDHPGRRDGDPGRRTGTSRPPALPTRTRRSGRAGSLEPLLKSGDDLAKVKPDDDEGDARSGGLGEAGRAGDGVVAGARVPDHHIAEILISVTGWNWRSSRPRRR